jgi:hypothetical protein
MFRGSSGAGRFAALGELSPDGFFRELLAGLFDGLFEPLFDGLFGELFDELVDGLRVGLFEGFPV